MPIFASKTASIPRLKSAVAHCAGKIEKKFWLLFKLKKTRLYAFAILRCRKSSKKKLFLKLTEHSKPNSFTNMVAKIDIDALKFTNK